MAVRSFGIFFGVVTILGTLMVQGKWHSGKLLAHPHRLAGYIHIYQNNLPPVMRRQKISIQRDNQL